MGPGESMGPGLRRDEGPAVSGVTAQYNAMQLIGRDRIVGYALLVLAVLCVVGPFAWILMSSFKHQIAILSGAWSFTPTLSNYTEVLFGRRSDFAGNVANSAIVAAASTANVASFARSYLMPPLPSGLLIAFGVRYSRRAMESQRDPEGQRDVEPIDAA